MDKLLWIWGCGVNYQFVWLPKEGSSTADWQLAVLLCPHARCRNGQSSATSSPLWQTAPVASDAWTSARYKGKNEWLTKQKDNCSTLYSKTFNFKYFHLATNEVDTFRCIANGNITVLTWFTLHFMTLNDWTRIFFPCYVILNVRYVKCLHSNMTTD